MVNITWPHFDSSVEQLIVCHTATTNIWIFCVYVKVNGFTSRLHGEGSYVCNRASDIYRSSFSAAVELHADPVPFKYNLSLFHIYYWYQLRIDTFTFWQCVWPTVKVPVFKLLMGRFWRFCPRRAANSTLHWWGEIWHRGFDLWVVGPQNWKC